MTNQIEVGSRVKIVSSECLGVLGKLGTILNIGDTKESHHTILYDVKLDNFDELFYWFSDDQLELVTTEPTSEIPCIWDNIDDNHQYVAMDVNGAWYAYDTCPEINLMRGIWGTKRGTYEFLTHQDDTINWGNSLMIRPEKYSVEGTADKLNPALEIPVDSFMGQEVYVDIDFNKTIKHAIVIGMRYTVDDEHEEGFMEYHVEYTNPDDQETEWVIHETVFLTSEEAFN